MNPLVPPRQREHAARFRELHRERVLVLPNAWDAASAAVIVASGASAIATTSAGISWSLGSPDGEKLAPEAMVAAVRRIVAAVDVPVSADIEAGYGASPSAVSEVLEAVIGAGVVGINLEDSMGGALLPPHDQAARIVSARETGRRLGLDVWINARTDVFLTDEFGGAEGIEATLARSEIYAEAGADSLFVPGVVHRDVIAALAKGPLPLNVMVAPGAASVPELTRLGVRRISAGMAMAQAAYGLVSRASREVIELGTYIQMDDGLGYDTLNSILER